MTLETHGHTLLVTFDGRLDAQGSNDAQSLFVTLGEQPDVQHVIFDLTSVGYLSSAGIRLFLMMQKWCSALGGTFSLVGVQPYCEDVLRISGAEHLFARHDTRAEAMAVVADGGLKLTTATGTFEFHELSDAPAAIEILGNINDVLYSAITPAHILSKPFSDKEYSIGLGALGPSVDDVINRLGEMITIGGTMVWLPTDGSDLPDFLIPRAESDAIQIRTGFNISLSGAFNEIVDFRSASTDGTTISELYRALFDAAKSRRPDFRGAIGLAMRAEVGAAYGAGLLRSPTAENAPADGCPVIDPAHFADWFEFDTEPRHRNVTALICGVGLDLTADTSTYDKDHLASTFYLNPANADADASQRDVQQLHNHAVLFHRQQFPDPPRELEAEIASVVEEGDFIDMRHLLDRTTITRARIGLIYVQDFRLDPTAARN